MDSVSYSKDLDALRDAVQLQQQMNQEIADFQRQLEEFTLAKVSLACVYFVLLKVKVCCTRYITHSAYLSAVCEVKSKLYSWLILSFMLQVGNQNCC